MTNFRKKSHPKITQLLSLTQNPQSKGREQKITQAFHLRFDGILSLTRPTNPFLTSKDVSMKRNASRRNGTFSSSTSPVIQNFVLEKDKKNGKYVVCKTQKVDFLPCSKAMDN